MIAAFALTAGLGLQGLIPSAGTQPAGGSCDAQALLDAIEDLRLKRTQEAARQAEAEVKNTVNPRFPATALATAASNSAGTPVDQALITPLLAFGVQTGLVESQGKAITISLNGLAIAKVLSPRITDDTDSYRDTKVIRRLGGKVTLGGPGDRFDRDGDGKEDSPLEASKPGDSVGWDVEYRAIGSRDRRDKEVADGVVNRIVESGKQVAAARANSELLEALLRIGGPSCISSLPELLGRGAIKPLWEAVRVSEAMLEQEIKDAFEPLDRAFVLTAFSAGVNRKDELGPNKLSFGLRAIWGTRRFDHTLNGTWERIEGKTGLARPTTIKIGYEASGMLMTSLLGYKAKSGLFAAWDRFQNVPTAKHRTVAQFGAKLELDISSGVKVPITLKWVNHRDLLSGADDVIGNVGIAIDLADLKKKPAEK